MNSTSTIKNIQEEIIEEFNFLEEWDEKYAYIIELGKKLPPLDEKYKTEQNKIKGCQSQVWLHSELNGDIVNYYADSDALIVKGLVSLLVRVLSGHKPSEILQEDLYFLDKIGMKQHLSPTRSNGLAAMVKQMKMYALAFSSKLNS
ncbi:MAG TPA: SufE family protein [Cytophagaceae bacterium]